jgi:hypothetical protein
VLPDALILVLCYPQVACPEMFSEELICTAVLLDEEERKSRKSKWEHESLLQRKEEGGIFYVRFQVLTAASMMFRVGFWDILPCKMIVD